jgi:hypothetical protein
MSKNHKKSTNKLKTNNDNSAGSKPKMGNISKITGKNALAIIDPTEVYPVRITVTVNIPMQMGTVWGNRAIIITARVATPFPPLNSANTG